jgi:CheY-like chemotaxis protein
MKHVLVCEDDHIVQKVIEVALQGKNVKATFVKDGRKALTELQHGTHFDLIITDIHMPFHNGDEILKVVREEQRKDTPVLMISSDTEEEVIRMALRSGVTEFISKPVDAVQLLKILNKYL